MHMVLLVSRCLVSDRELGGAGLRAGGGVWSESAGRETAID